MYGILCSCKEWRNVCKNLLRKMKKHIDRSGIILYTNIRRLDV